MEADRASCGELVSPSGTELQVPSPSIVVDTQESITDAKARV